MPTGAPRTAAVAPNDPAAFAPINPGGAAALPPVAAMNAVRRPKFDAWAAAQGVWPPAGQEPQREGTAYATSLQALRAARSPASAPDRPPATRHVSFSRPAPDVSPEALLRPDTRPPSDAAAARVTGRLAGRAPATEYVLRPPH